MHGDLDGVAQDLQTVLARLRDEAESSLRAFIPASAGRVLDCACGDGSRGRKLLEKGVGEVVGIERDVVLARSAAGVCGQVLTGNLEDLALPFDDGSFDCVLCHDVLARARDPKGVLEKISRLCAPDGLLIATAPNIQFFPSVVMLANGEVAYEGGGVWDRDHIHFFTGYELLRLFWECGLDDTRLTGLVVAPPEVMPMDGRRRLRQGRVEIGPLDDNEFLSYRTEIFAAIAAPGHQRPPSPSERH